MDSNKAYVISRIPGAEAIQRGELWEIQGIPGLVSSGISEAYAWSGAADDLKSAVGYYRMSKLRTARTMVSDASQITRLPAGELRVGHELVIQEDGALYLYGIREVLDGGRGVVSVRFGPDGYACMVRNPTDLVDVFVQRPGCKLTTIGPEIVDRFSNGQRSYSIED